MDFTTFKIFAEQLRYRLNRTIELPSFPLSKTGKQALLRFIPRPKSDPALIHTIHGYKLFVDNIAAGIEGRLLLFGTYERGTLEIMDLILENGSVFVDGGANIGFMALYASRRVGPSGKVLAFEPHPATFSKLLKNKELNAFGTNIETIPLALSDADGSGVLYEHITESPGSNSMLSSFAGKPQVEIEQTTLDEFLQHEQRLDLVKLDIEGYESKAILGGLCVLREHQPALIVEVNQEISSTEDVDRLMNLLVELGYTLFKPILHMHKRSQIKRVTNREELSDFNNLYAFTAKHLHRIPKKTISDK